MKEITPFEILISATLRSSNNNGQEQDLFTTSGVFLCLTLKARKIVTTLYIIIKYGMVTTPSSLYKSNTCIIILY